MGKKLHILWREKRTVYITLRISIIQKIKAELFNDKQISLQKTLSIINVAIYAESIFHDGADININISSI